MTTSKPRTPRVYLVTTPEPGAPVRLVRALTPQGAIKYATTRYSASVATQQELIAALSAHIEVEDASDEEPSL